MRLSGASKVSNLLYDEKQGLKIDMPQKWWCQKIQMTLSVKSVRRRTSVSTTLSFAFPIFKICDEIGNNKQGLVWNARIIWECLTCLVLSKLVLVCFRGFAAPLNFKAKLSGAWSMRRGGVLPEKFGRGVRPASQNPHPIYDLTKNLIPYLWPNS